MDENRGRTMYERWRAACEDVVPTWEQLMPARRAGWAALAFDNDEFRAALVNAQDSVHQLGFELSGTRATLVATQRDLELLREQNELVRDEVRACQDDLRVARVVIVRMRKLLDDAGDV